NDSGASIFIIGNDAPVIEMRTVPGGGNIRIQDSNASSGGRLKMSADTAAGSQLTLADSGSSGENGVNLVANDSGASFFVMNGNADVIKMRTVPGGGNIRIRDTDETPDGVVIMATNSSGAKVGIGTETPSEALHVVGNICATGTIGACSDARFKEHVETIGDAMAVIEKLRGVDFDWKRSEFADHQFTDGKQLGFVAQEVKDVLPMLVSEGSDGYLSVDYGRLTPVLVEAVKAQQKIIDNQNGELSAVKAQLEKLQKLVSKLLEETNSSTVR
ncbi:MAG: tail fiber domain-containing protein, partial [Limisphaerales bacterium]